MFSGIIAQNLPILIAGPTASGKSALGLRLAKECDGVVINADALQVYSDWRILTARPSTEEESQAPHRLYGHVGLRQSYSTGHWLAEVKAVLAELKVQNMRPIILGGTGLYFQALTKGLTDVPAIDADTKAEAAKLLETSGREVFAELVAKSDPETATKIDMQNPARTQRAWEVINSTGIGLSEWQARTPPPMVPEKEAHCIRLDCDVDWLNDRIERRFDQMIEGGALEECQNVMHDGWDETLPSCQAIGAKELIAHVKGELRLSDAILAGKTQSKQYAKRQRTWLRSKMTGWHSFDPRDSQA